MSSLGIDYGRLEEAGRRLAQAGELVKTITNAARELDALVDDPDDPVAYALDTAARMNGHGASPPDAPAELGPGAGPPSSPAPPAAATVAPPPAAAHQVSRDDSQEKGPPAAPTARNAPGTSTDAVLKWLEAHPDEWHRIGTVARAVGLTTATVKGILYRLRETETVEWNGRGTSASRWRLDPGLAAELVEVPSPIDPGAEGGEEETEEEAGIEDRGPDVKRDLERAGLAPPLRSAGYARPPAGSNGAGLTDEAREAVRAAQREHRGELRERIRAHLLDEASTISELALALDVPRRELAPLVLELEEDDAEPVVKVEGALRGRGETIYSNIA